jgi:hypothetical protein
MPVDEFQRGDRRLLRGRFIGQASNQKIVESLASGAGADIKPNQNHA